MPRLTNSNITHGAVSGVDVGTRFDSMNELLLKGVHGSSKRFHVTNKLMNSVILSPQDKDDGMTITVRLNSALKQEPDTIKAFQNNQYRRVPIPVRVIRSHKCGGQFAPLTGYRYDGLYNVCHIINELDRDTDRTEWYVFLRRLEDQPIFWQLPPMLGGSWVTPQSDREIQNETGNRNV